MDVSEHKDRMKIFRQILRVCFVSWGVFLKINSSTFSSVTEFEEHLEPRRKREGIKEYRWLYIDEMDEK